MKKFVAMILVLSMVLSICACGEQKTEKAAETKPVETVEPKPDEVKQVERLIAAIGEVRLEREKYITDAEQAYAALLEADKELVENAADLAEAREAYNGLLKQEADKVMQAISSIGKVNREKEEQIIAAEAAYATLSDEVKALVENYNELTSARYSLDILNQLFGAEEQGKTTIEIDGVKVSYVVGEDQWAVVENELTEEYEPADLAYTKQKLSWTGQNLRVVAEIPAGWHTETTTERGFAFANKDVTMIMYIWSGVLTEKQKQYLDSYAILDAVATTAIGSSREHGQFHHTIYAQRRASWCRVDMDGYDTVFVFMLDGDNLVVLQAYNTNPDIGMTKQLLGIAVHCINNMTIGTIE